MVHHKRLALQLSVGICRRAAGAQEHIGFKKGGENDDFEHEVTINKSPLL